MKMRIVVSDPDGHRRARVGLLLTHIPTVTLSASCSDLSKTFDTIEHRPPHLVLYAAEFTKLPEFEAMETLCRHLSVRWNTFGFAAPGFTATDGDVDLSNDTDAILQNLQAIMTGKVAAARGSSLGLFHSPSKVETDQIILIGSSTGGVDALLHVLGTFPSDCPPTLIVQHTGASFSAGLARLLDSRVEPRVIEARCGEALRPGVVMIAPGSDAHLVLDGKAGQRCKLEVGERVSGHRPSVDALFKSANPIAERVIAVILTGMGRDGAQGLLDLKTAGAETIGQDEDTSLVYGMPRAAAELGAVRRVLPLSAIGPTILRSVQRRSV